MDESAQLYFDNAATSYPKPPSVYEELDCFARSQAGSAGRSAHRHAIAGARLMFELRNELAALLGGIAETLAFTKNATEALNVALFGLVHPGAVVAHGPLEHNAVARPLAWLAEQRGVKLVEVPGDEQGRVTPAALAATLSAGRVDLFVTLHASNVHGLAQDLAGLGEVCRSRAVPFVVDAAQSAGALVLDARGMNIDVLCVTGHKALLGPTGTGALLLSADAAERVPPLLHGGTGSLSSQETMPGFLPDRLEAGTPNTLGLAGLLAGVRYLAERGVADVAAHERRLRERLRERLRAIPGLRLLGDDPGPATATLSFVGPLAPSEFAARLDERGVAVRAGLHCAPRAHRTLGTFPQGTVRLSPGAFTTLDEVDRVCAAVSEIAGGRS